VLGSYVYEVDQMGALTDKIQLVDIRTLVLQRCHLPKYSNTTFCSLLPTWLKSLEKELQLVETAHQVGMVTGVSQALLPALLARANVIVVDGRGRCTGLQMHETAAAMQRWRHWCHRCSQQPLTTWA
jgi:hypothetical protein